jgi:hypothetical protein
MKIVATELKDVNCKICKNIFDRKTRSRMCVPCTSIKKKLAVSKYNKEYYKKNEDAIKSINKIRSKEYYKNNKDKIKAINKIRSKKYYDANKDKLQKLARDRYAHNKQKTDN